MSKSSTSTTCLPLRQRFTRQSPTTCLGAFTPSSKVVAQSPSTHSATAQALALGGQSAIVVQVPEVNDRSSILVTDPHATTVTDKPSGSAKKAATNARVR
jgi:hypothetical protein